MKCLYFLLLFFNGALFGMERLPLLRPKPVRPYQPLVLAEQGKLLPAKNDDVIQLLMDEQSVDWQGQRPIADGSELVDAMLQNFGTNNFRSRKKLIDKVNALPSDQRCQLNDSVVDRKASRSIPSEQVEMLKFIMKALDDTAADAQQETLVEKKNHASTRTTAFRKMVISGALLVTIGVATNIAQHYLKFSCN